MEFADLVTDDAVKQCVPTLRTEVIGTRVITRHARGGTHPDESLTVVRQSHNPVVTQTATSLVLLREIQIAQTASRRIVDTKSTRVGGDIKITSCIASHIVEAVAVESELLFRMSR